MAARTSNPRDLINWTKSVIDSCTQFKQEMAARNLISLLDIRLERLGFASEIRWAVNKSLRDRLESKLYKK